MNQPLRNSWAPVFLFVATLLFFNLGTAQAAGIGVYYEYGNVDGDIEGADFDAEQSGVGVVFDSNLARDSLFNYRGSFGYRSSTFDTILGDLDAAGFEMNHLIGFGIFRTPRFRLIVGPAIRIGVDVFDKLAGTDWDLVNLDFGLGPEIALNLHVARNLTVSTWVAYQYHYRFLYLEGDSPPVAQTFDGEAHVVKVGFSVFFRTSGDQFR